VSDTRKVRPVAPLDAERIESVVYNGRPWLVAHPSDGMSDFHYSDDEFAAAFMPAELFDAVLDAARVVARFSDPNGDIPIDPLRKALRAYDARTGEGL